MKGFFYCACCGEYYSVDKMSSTFEDECVYCEDILEEDDFDDEDY